MVTVLVMERREDEEEVDIEVVTVVAMKGRE